MSTVITPMAVLRRPDEFGELLISEVHPGLTVEQVKTATGWDIPVAPDVCETGRPTEEDVRLLREEIDTVRLRSPSRTFVRGFARNPAPSPRRLG